MAARAVAHGSSLLAQLLTGVDCIACTVKPNMQPSHTCNKTNEMHGDMFHQLQVIGASLHCLRSEAKHAAFRVPGQ